MYCLLLTRKYEKSGMHGNECYDENKIFIYSMNSNTIFLPDVHSPITILIKAIIIIKCSNVIIMIGVI